MSNCPECGSNEWDHANVGLIDAIVCTNCGEIYMMKDETTKPNEWVKPREWREITKGQIDECLKHSDNYDFAWAIEHICRLNNGYPPHENFKPEVSGSIKWSKPV
jgi:hypothetical protein